VQFTSDRPGQFEVAAQALNRWGTVATEEFHVSPAKGIVDPLAPYENLFLSNERRFSPNSTAFLSSPVALPATVHLPLTEWLRFDRPGHYRISLWTFRVSSRPATPGEAGRVLPLDTNVVKFDIIPADGAWQDRQLKELESQTPLDWPRLRALANIGGISIRSTMKRCWGY
jgi:hypothetical protein